MNVSNINGTIKINQNPFQTVNTSSSGTSFANVLQGYLNNVNNTVQQSDNLNTQLAAGTIDNLSDVTIASEKAKLALELTTTVRDKAVEAYQDIMRMQF